MESKVSWLWINSKIWRFWTPYQQGDTSSMCGIFGYVTNKEEALGPILIEAAQRLTYRGYDSVGAATLNNGTIDLRKDVGKVDAVATQYNIAEVRGFARSETALPPRKRCSRGRDLLFMNTYAIPRLCESRRGGSGERGVGECSAACTTCGATHPVSGGLL